MYKFLLGLIISTMVVLVSCSPQEQEAYANPKPAVSMANSNMADSNTKHRVVDLSQSLEPTARPVFPL